MAESDAAQPALKITITVRIIKSFEYRTAKNLVLHGAAHATPDAPDATFTLETTVAELKQICKKAVVTQPGWKPYQNVALDTMKLYFFAHGQKTSNLIINIDKDDMFMDDSKTLGEVGVGDETEISFFNREAYEAYKAHPDTKW